MVIEGRMVAPGESNHHGHRHQNHLISPPTHTHIHTQNNNHQPHKTKSTKNAKQAKELGQNLRPAMESPSGVPWSDAVLAKRSAFAPASGACVRAHCVCLWSWVDGWM